MKQRLSDAGRRTKRTGGMRDGPTGSELGGSQMVIQEWLKGVRFRKALFGGVRESDVWKKIAELHTLYEQALAVERIRYETLLAERMRMETQSVNEVDV